MTTRQEQSGERDLKFSQWIRDKLPDSSDGYMVSDLDFILHNYKTRKLMLLEVKTYGASVSTWQRMLFDILDRALKNGCQDDVEYLGFHVIRFQTNDFSGIVTLDGEPVEEDELIQFLSF